MQSNIFKFGSEYFWQKLGTALWELQLPAYATLYYAWLKKKKLLPVYQDQQNVLPFLVLFINDKLGICWGPMNTLPKDNIFKLMLIFLFISSGNSVS